MIYIYALTDPRNQSIRYIGKSIRPFFRVKDHMNDRQKNHRTNWLRSLRDAGLEPVLSILEELPDDADWQESERRWIATGHASGWPLTNGTSGGDGVRDLCPEAKARMATTWVGRKHSPESVERIRIACTGRVKTEAMKQVMRDKMKGRKIEWIDKVAKALQKLTDDQVIDIRRRLKEGEKQTVLAKEFGVDKGTISNIKRRVCYRHIPE